ncbi:hypothetical protein GF325_08455 [Candidatus Bathyarchaeota archaeon]|nr:hypothetical protein [Candidatus Bathyarchaeota archaeon]
MKFPEIEAKNLENEPVNIPDHLHCALNVLIVAFKRWHQELVDTWIPHLARIKQGKDDFDFYELPTLGKIYSLGRFFIDGGMRTGIPSKQTRKHTITLYLDKDEFKKALHIQDESTIHLFLVKPDGNILWHGAGKYDRKTFEDLMLVMENN